MTKGYLLLVVKDTLFIEMKQQDGYNTNIEH